MSSEYCCEKCAEDSRCARCGDTEVKESQNGYCVPCWDEMFHEKMSYESNHCPGCDEELIVRANGYCASCWVDRFGCEDLSPISFSSENSYEYSEEAAIRIQTWWRKLKQPICYGCQYNVLNQQGHMSFGGCLYEPENEFSEFSTIGSQQND
jgi:hypothetical protein